MALAANASFTSRRPPLDRLMTTQGQRELQHSRRLVISRGHASMAKPSQGPIDRGAAWEDHRNKHHAKANWQFTTDDARVKLKRLYPLF